MARKKKAAGGQKKKKPVTVELIKDENSTPHVVMRNIQAEYYPELSDAKIGLFWKYGWKAEADTGTVKLWAVRKATETIRALSKFDLCIYLNAELWGLKGWTQDHADFVLDSALREIQADRDRDGDQKVDEKNRELWRIVKPTIQTFPEIVDRHGLVTVELQKLAQAVHRHDEADRPLFDWLNDQPVASAEESTESEQEAASAA